MDSAFPGRAWEQVFLDVASTHEVFHNAEDFRAGASQSAAGGIEFTRVLLTEIFHHDRRVDAAGDFIGHRTAAGQARRGHVDIDGFGLLGFESLVERDYPVVMGILVISSLLFMLGNILSDLCAQLVGGLGFAYAYLRWAEWRRGAGRTARRAGQTHLQGAVGGTRGPTSSPHVDFGPCEPVSGPREAATPRRLAPPGDSWPAASGESGKVVFDPP